MKKGTKEQRREALMDKYRKTLGPQERTGIWETFEGFYSWAMDNDYQLGDMIFKKKRSLPYSPDNCGFCHVKREPAAELGGKNYMERVRAWNRAVNPLRIAAGLEPFADPWEEEKALPE